MMTEAEALADILSWSANIPDIQRQFLHKFATDGTSLEPDKICEFIAKAGSVVPPLNVADWLYSSGDRRPVYLRSVHSVRHVNALASDQKLTFGSDGLTIIYGDNGSGKSGYARILKKVCRARMPARIEEIIPDIYDTAPGTPSAKIDYAINGQNRTCEWELGQHADLSLLNINVFDSRTANIHVDKANDVAYTPYPLQLLEMVAQACKWYKDSLSAGIAQIKAQTPQSIKSPACNSMTAVGRLIAGLTADTDPAIVEALATLTQAEQERLAQLTADLVGDPARTARQLTALKTKFEGYIARLDGLFASIAEESANNLRQLSVDSDTARRAAETASDALFRDEPLPQIGSEVWQALWTSARAFSDQEAYPEQNFPVTGHGSVCVLCQQELTPVAIDRFNRFEAFVRDDSQHRADAVRIAYDEAFETFKGATLSLAELASIVAAVRDELRQDVLASEIKNAVLCAMWRHRQIRRCHANPAAVLNVPIVAFSCQTLTDQFADIGTRANALAADANSPAHAALITEKSELADRQWLSGIKADVLAEIDRLKQIAQLETLQKEANTNRITNKSSEIARALVTDALQAQFAREIESLEITDLAVELRQQNSAQGITRFKVVLTRVPNAVVGQVLSEGEYRCVALAAFMAELATTENRSGIVFDDPVSSLDHRHRAAIAKRLVAESMHRQVIVFTHDLAFLFELQRAAKRIKPKPQCAAKRIKPKLQLQIRSVSRGAREAGFCRDEPPFKARKASKIMSSLRNQLANERYHFDQGNEDKWRITVKSIVGMLRDTWEIAVEEVVGHVILRLSNEVKTLGLVKLTAITVSDCEDMRKGFSRCSELLHSAAQALNRPLPSPEALSAEIEALSDWVDRLQKCQGKIS